MTVDTNPVVRWARPDDALAIAQIGLDAWQTNYRGQIADSTLDGLSLAPRLAAWQRRFDEGARVLAAVAAGELLGWVQIGGFRITDEAGPEVARLAEGWGELLAFYVAPRAQRSGVGTLLWQAARDSLEAEGYRDVGLWTLSTNAPAIRFYEACGFRDQRLDQSFEINGQPLVETLLARSLISDV
ncbi:GNAT family N-acetyltransferase [Salinicola rhizosphaerae]|uniref:N-acetyltransferase n=1 Tax=Salinicola rhizosphaerae TaxID=1443141 RepID=A0ABQ3DUZ0_9GAMM|nr:GNAT family N-acetyltransferase [Salinicola rhizosphaerae]GHB16397.1 N-acetyltransferase [Salinicola rhizosphaerae]